MVIGSQKMIAELNTSDYYGFKLSENGSVSSVDNDCCMTCHKAFAYHGSNTSLICNLQRAQLIHAILFLTEINR